MNSDVLALYLTASLALIKIIYHLVTGTLNTGVSTISHAISSYFVLVVLKRCLRCLNIEGLCQMVEQKRI